MILVTGGTGLVGGHLLYRFRESDKPIRAIYRTTKSLEKTRKIFNSYPRPCLEFLDRIEWIQADILDLPSLKKAFSGVTEVYHCAAIVDANVNFQEIKKLNVEGTANVVNLALAHGIKKFCHVSSIATLELKVGQDQIDERSTFNIESLHSDYAISKYGGELEVWRASQEGLNVVIVNPGVILGEGNYTSGSGQIIDKCSQGLNYYTSGGSGFVDVRDVVEAMIALMEAGHFQERFILVAENRSFKSVIEEANKSFGQSSPKRKLPDWLIWFLAYVDVVFHLFAQRHFLSKANASALTTTSVYSNEKVLQTLPDFNFKQLDKTLQRIAEHYKSSEKISS